MKNTIQLFGKNLRVSANESNGQVNLYVNGHSNSLKTWTAKEFSAMLRQERSLDIDLFELRLFALNAARNAAKQQLEQTPNDILRAAGLTFGRQDRRANNTYRAKWGIRGVSVGAIKELQKLLEARTGVISARVEDVADTQYNNCYGAVNAKMFILRTSVPPTEIKLVKR